MKTLDLLSQVLFVALMAMLLYILYRRFIRMMSRDRVQGRFAHIAVCTATAPGQCQLVLESEKGGECRVSWKEGNTAFTFGAGRHEETITVPEGVAELVFTFDNQVIRRRIG